mgnify:FL=1
MSLSLSGVSFEVLSPRFMGVPLRVRVRRHPGIGRNDYIELLDNRGVRKTWEWAVRGASGEDSSREF